MSSIQDHYCSHADTSIFNIQKKNSKGEWRCCSMKQKNNGKWYGLKDPFVDPQQLSFCQHCAHVFLDTERLFEVTEDEYPQLKDRLICDAYDTNTLLKYGLHRCLNYQGLRVNVNVRNPYDDNFTPTMVLHSQKGLKAMENGVLITSLSSHSYWEFVIQGDPNGKYSNSENTYFKIEKAAFADGRTVTYSNSSGNTNLYSKLSGYNKNIVNIDSYQSGDSSQRFFFISSSNNEKNYDLQPLHENQSNILYLTLSIYNKIPNVKYNQQCRGVTRSITRGNNFSGGSNLSSHGDSNYVKSQYTDATFDKIDTVNITLQLVCHDSDEEKDYNVNLINEQIYEKKRKLLEKLKKERDELDKKIYELENETPHRHSVIDNKLTHSEQTEFLM